MVDPNEVFKGLVNLQPVYSAVCNAQRSLADPEERAFLRFKLREAMKELRDCAALIETELPRLEKLEKQFAEAER